MARSAGRPDRHSGVDPRRDRRRQGVARPRDPRLERAGAGPLREDELRGDRGGHARQRALRPRPRDPERERSPALRAPRGSDPTGSRAARRRSAIRGPCLRGSLPHAPSIGLVSAGTTPSSIFARGGAGCQKSRTRSWDFGAHRDFGAIHRVGAVGFGVRGRRGDARPWAFRAFDCACFTRRGAVFRELEVLVWTGWYGAC